MDLQISVTSRRTVGECTVEEKIVIGAPPKPVPSPLGLSLLSLGMLAPRRDQEDTTDTATASAPPEDEGHVRGTAEDMAEALRAISTNLGCANTEEDIQHAIDALRAQASPRLEWSGTLCDGERVDYATAEKACAALGDGWRLPTRPELESILDLARHDPAVDPARFPDTKSGWYWTSTPCAWSSDRAWCVVFGNGIVYNGRRDNLNAFVRAVRAVPAGQ